MNRWKPLVFGLVIALLTGLSISHAQEEGAEEAAPGFAVEQESVSELMEEDASGSEMIADPEVGLRRRKVTLLSTNPDYPPIILSDHDAESVEVVAEFATVLRGN